MPVYGWTLAIFSVRIFNLRVHRIYQGKRVVDKKRLTPYIIRNINKFLPGGVP
jgi:hypothetical protein